MPYRAPSAVADRLARLGESRRARNRSRSAARLGRCIGLGDEPAADDADRQRQAITARATFLNASAISSMSCSSRAARVDVDRALEEVERARAVGRAADRRRDRVEDGLPERVDVEVGDVRVVDPHRRDAFGVQRVDRLGSECRRSRRMRSGRCRRRRRRRSAAAGSGREAPRPARRARRGSRACARAARRAAPSWTRAIAPWSSEARKFQPANRGSPAPRRTEPAQSCTSIASS